MHDIWSKTINVNESLVRELIPHREQLSPICMANEITILPFLHGRLSFPIPNLTMIGNPTGIYPFQFSGYEILEGELLTEYQDPLIKNPEFAIIMGTWLSELHALPILNVHKDLIQGEHGWRVNVAHRCQRAVETIIKYKQYFVELGFEPDLLIKKINSFQDLKIDKTPECYVHGDLYAKHILVKANGLPAGLIDWGDIHIGHPASDISICMMIFNETSMKYFLNAYKNYNRNMIDFALFRAFFHSILALPYFVQVKKVTTINWIKAALYNTIHLIDQKESFF